LAAVSAESSAGVLPSSGGREGEVGFTQFVTPQVGLTDSRHGFTMTYVPQFSWFLPAPDGLRQPALLHLATLDYELYKSTRSTFTGEAGASYGELNYFAVSQVYGDEQTSTPNDALVRVLTARIGLDFSRQLTRRWSISVQLPVDYSTTRGGDGAAGAGGSTWTTGLLPQVSHRLTRIDQLSLALGAQLVKFERPLFPDTTELSSRANMTWGRSLSRRLDMSLSAGGGRIDVLKRAGDETSGARYFALAGFSLARRREFGTDSVALNLDAQPDPIRLQLRPMASLTVDTSEQLSKRWTVSAGLRGFGPATTRPETTAATQSPTETGVSAHAALAWAASPVTLTLGIRGGVRGPHWSEPFVAREEEIAGTLGATWAIWGPAQ
jgi:hypothetical protein